MKNFFHGSVKVYTKGMAGEAVYIGVCKMKREHGGYCVRIPDGQYRLSATGEFLLMPSRLFCLLHRGEAVKVRVCGREVVTAVQLVIAIEGKIC